jgi:hypothetical protein
MTMGICRINCEPNAAVSPGGRRYWRASRRSPVRGCTLSGRGPRRRSVTGDVVRYHLQGVNRDGECAGFNGLVVVVFGFGPGSPEDQGEVAPCVCPNCHNQVFLHHIRSKKSVRLYFVPVVPYGTDDYLVCPVCSRGLQVSGAQLRHVRSMSSATASFRAGRLPQAGYMAQAERFWRQLGVDPAGQQLLTAASSGAPGPARPAAPVTAAAAPAPPGPPAADDQTPWISHLHHLAQLHDQGVLSDAAYTAAKRRILHQDGQPPSPGPESPPAS